MKICDVIDEVKRVKRGYDIDDNVIIRGINTVEAMVFNEIVKGRVGEEKYKEFSSYDYDTSRDTQLLIPEPYSNMYEYYCLAQVDAEFDETDRYENDMTRFNQSYKDYAIFYTREHSQIHNYNYYHGGK